MSNNYKHHGSVIGLILFLTTICQAQPLVHYWNFNDNTSAVTITTPSQSAVAGAGISAVAGGISTIDFAGGTGQNFNILNLNSQNGDVSGTHLRFNDPIGGALVFSLPTTGYENVTVKFATRRSGSGAGTQKWSYSADGTTFLPLVSILPNNGDPALATLDLTAIAAADNNTNFKLKVEFEAGSGGTVGNNRFDNFTLNATPIPLPVLLHYWNFNDNSSVSAITTPSFSAISGSSISALPGGISTIDAAGGTGQSFNVQNLNARNGAPSGSHLRFNDPIGGALLFAVPTTGYENIIVTFATRRSGSGAGTQLWSYSIDGINFIALNTILPNNGDPLLETLDLTGIAAADNNPNLKLKVEFAPGSGGTVGNNRFDNFAVDGNAIGGGDAIAPVAVVSPSNSSSNVAVTSAVTISFNENVRLINNSAINNTNVDALVELRLNNAGGTVVPFDATFTANAITITPTVSLANNQVYYAVLLPNAVEDLSDNAVANGISSTFTTIAVQTQFAPGDLAFVAYRMNAIATEDEIAFITFVDIIPGTFITFTDSKFTTNVPAQCANGIIWTAAANECVPAGTVVTIQTSALLASTGTVTGSGFGLSSGGDQVIAYTGSNTAPNYITALSSNGWVASNTSCSGSASMLPAGLSDGISALNTSTAPGSTAGNTVNAYYNGSQTGTFAQLKAAILNPQNWTGVAGGTAAQTWPTWNFPSSLQVQSGVVLNNTTIQLTFNNNLNAASATNLANYSGLSGLSSVAISNNVATLTFSTAFTPSVTYNLIVSNLMDASGSTMACPYTFTFSFNTTVGFASSFVTVQESAGTLNFTINLASPATGSVNLVVKGAPFSTADNNDFTLATQTLSFTGSSALTQTVTIPVLDDMLEEQQAEYFVLSLENPVGLSITGNPNATIYIKDNDRLAPVASQQIELNYIGSFDPSGSSSSTCEIVVHDPASQRLFTTSAIAGFLDIINFSDPSAPALISSIDMNSYGGVTSVAVKNGIVAVASPNNDETLAGSVVFFTTNGVFQKQVTVGSLPDMITFSPDGTKVITANEGQPNANYSVDPEGSVSIIDISGGVASLTQANVTTLLFTAYNSQEAALVASGVRKLKSTSTLSQDFEPEYVTIAANSQTAWVSLQENNAIAEINLTTNTITDVWALGTKDIRLAGNGFDISDNNNDILIANWPIDAFYLPDGIATYSVGGTNYIVTANEGDEKEYAGLTERTTVGAATYALDPAIFPNASVLKETFNMGRFRVSNLSGNLDADTEFEKINAVGTRSFSIFNATTKQIVFDSGDDFEMYTAANLPALFNADHEDNTPKGRSRAKGPEPEGVTTAVIGTETFAFISLERVGGVMVYNITDPANATLVDYKNSRSSSSYAGDHGPEGITYVSPQNSPTGIPYILVANEISGTITIFEVDTNSLSAPGFAATPTFALFPNPSTPGLVYFNRPANIEIFDMTGKRLYQAADVSTINTATFSAGIYLVKTSEGIVKRMVIN
ncbi:MAG TPA: choice-of-anchor I family protein [Flavobacterium sp.]|jgi:hypothetical protein